MFLNLELHVIIGLQHWINSKTFQFSKIPITN